MEIKEYLDKVLEVMEEKKAKEITTIDIRELSPIADYFVICTGTSTTHIKAISDEVDFKLGQAGLQCKHLEGYDTARWILMDYGDIIVHVFHDEDRNFYNLERMWSDGIRVNVSTRV